MKEKLTTIVTTVVTTLAILAFAGLAGAGPLAQPSPEGGAPTVVSYQGQVVLDGAPYDGDGYFKFALVDQAGTTTFWSNDGSSSGGGEPELGVTLPVARGLFNVLLGDDTLKNMVPLDAGAFDESERYLRVWFSSDGSAFQQLSPDWRVAAVPYSFQAQEAANADMVDGYHGASLEESSEIDADIAAHTAIADAHHARYTDAEAWAAVVANDGPGSGLDADRVDGLHASAFADATHNHPPSNISPQGSGSGLDADMVDGLHANDLELPTGAMVLGATENETTLIAAGFSYTGHTLSNSWSARADMPTGRSYLAAAAVDGVIYVIGGRSDATNSETVNEAYDPATDSWSTKAAMPTGRWLLAAATVNGIIYAIGGEANMTPETANEAYDPATDSWSTKAPLPTARCGLAAAAVDGIIYAIGGRQTAAYQTANEAYDPATDSWSTKAAMPTARDHLAAATVNGIIYAIGGWDGTSYLTANEAYDPATDSWTTRAPMPTGRTSLAAATVNGIIYAIVGYSATANGAYDPATDSWSTKAAMPTARYGLAAATVDGFIYAIGGWNGTSYQTANEVFDPAQWYVYRKQ